MPPRSSAVVILAMITLGGCTTDVGGVAAPAFSTSAAPELPARAKDLSLRGVDPCTLLTTAQLDRLKENGAPRPLAKDVQRDGPTCAFDVDAATPTYTYYLETIDGADVQDWLTGSRHKASMTQQLVDVPGFPALVDFAPSDGVQDCETLVGVADGQTLRAEMAPDDRSFTQQQLCDMSTTVAKMAVETLEAVK
ncbi:DUF3558 domain-containing protein [Amycolatopsis acidiphila]|uniref:DUF3558 domain-containing protein n=1 Tax=Amycolatopsis acidiphila TaxID=715473 RepID=A0A558AGW2_9PSEU|nr:DUF3558 domain-containing protein [Amycolatopsis acidiphila]TVT23515.1 DUF3558 domain-containing protein [Amycolatopsis acidiphila]UIJ59975.1 DUF3558 domain-containing protein [Amycolatopsis acidiphila]